MKIEYEPLQLEYEWTTDEGAIERVFSQTTLNGYVSYEYETSLDDTLKELVRLAKERQSITTERQRIVEYLEEIGLEDIAEEILRGEHLL